MDANADGIVDYYNPDVLSAQDYYPGGMPMPGRSFTAAGSTSYRFGFNGKENDNEVKKDANGKDIVGAQQDYGMRIYDPRLGRFLSVDPLESDFPFYTPYQFASNNPIVAIDLDGLEAVVVVSGKPSFKKDNYRGQFFMYQVKIYENTTLDQYNTMHKNGVLKQPTSISLLSRDAWQKPGRAGRSESRYGALNETPPGTYFLEYNSSGYGDKKYTIKLSDKKGDDIINGPDGQRTGVRVHEYSPFDAVGCLTCGSGKDKKPVQVFAKSIPSLIKHKEVRIILEPREAEYNKSLKIFQGSDNKENTIPEMIRPPAAHSQYTPLKLF